MSYHLIENIFINLPITVAYQRLWQLLLSADGLQAFNHYFKTNSISKKSSTQFQREIFLRIPQKLQPQTSDQQFPSDTIKILQKVTKNQKQKKILYQTVTTKQQQKKKPLQKSPISGDFFHQFQQNNKGEVYLIFTSSYRNGIKSFPEHSQVQIQLMKIKDLIQNTGNNFDKDTKVFKKCF